MKNGIWTKKKQQPYITMVINNKEQQQLSANTQWMGMYSQIFSFMHRNQNRTQQAEIHIQHD